MEFIESEEHNKKKKKKTEEKLTETYKQFMWYNIVLLEFQSKMRQ